MGNSGTAIGIIGIILAAGAIGFAFFIWNDGKTKIDDLEDQVNNINGPSETTQTKVVGLWDKADDNRDYAPHNLQNDWLFEFQDNKYNDSGYISVSNTNTRITLLQSGWYRIHLSTLLASIQDGYTYDLKLLKDGVLDKILSDYRAEGMTVASSHSFDTSMFVYSNGTNYIEINGYCQFDDFYPFFGATSAYSQFVIEFVVL